MIKLVFYWKLACSFVYMVLLPICNFGGQLELPALAYMLAASSSRASVSECPRWTVDRRGAGVQQYLDCICIGMAEEEQEQRCEGVEENKKRLKGSNCEWK